MDSWWVERVIEGSLAPEGNPPTSWKLPTDDDDDDDDNGGSRRSVVSFEQSKSFMKDRSAEDALT
jgi:hypothetical protein